MKRMLVAVVATAVGCAEGSSYVAEPPQQERARGPEHSAALAKELLNAEGEGEARVITETCDLCYAAGDIDGFGIGVEWSEGIIKTHCIGAITPDMRASFLAEAGSDRSKLREKAEKACEGPRFRRPASKYGETLLLVTRRCAGNRMCGVTLQTACASCYVPGVKESLGAETEKALDRMFQTCTLFHAEEPACHNSALSMMNELRTMVAGLPNQRPGQ
jgi:hypothetical protein